MNKEEKKSTNNNLKYILLFLLILFVAFGIWKCPNASEVEPKVELPQEKEDIKLEETVKSDVLPEEKNITCLLYTSPSPRDATLSRMPSSA